MFLSRSFAVEIAEEGFKTEWEHPLEGNKEPEKQV